MHRARKSDEGYDDVRPYFFLFFFLFFFSSSKATIPENGYARKDSEIGAAQCPRGGQNEERGVLLEKKKNRGRKSQSRDSRGPGIAPGQND